MARTPRTRILLALLGLHLLWVGVRVPYSVGFRRIAEVRSFQERGSTSSFLGSGHLRGAAIVEWIRANTAEDSIVLYDGPRPGALEFVPPLLFPRLLVADHSIAPGAVTWNGRAIARGTLDGATGRIVVIGRGDDLGLELR